MSAYLYSLIEEGEHENLDFKFEIADPQKIAKTFSAFANTGGGRLLIGVKDNGAIAGIRTEDEMYMADLVASRYTEPEVEFTTQMWNVEGKVVLEVIIPEGNSKPYYVKMGDEKKAYLRVVDENFLANGLILEYWKAKQKRHEVKIIYGEENKFLLDYLTNHETINISQFIRNANISVQRARQVLLNMLLVGVIKYTVTGTGVFFKLTDSYSEIEDL